MREILDDDLYNIEWRDIENAEMDYENYLDDIEGFFKEDFEDEEEINSETIDNMKELEELTREIREKLPRMDFEIIGKEPMLNDVMQYLWKLVEEESENSDDLIFAIGQLTNVFDQHCWNFNFPYLKYQSPELIKFLHSLIKTKQ